MTIWRFLPYMLVVLFCLCGMTVAAELTLTTGETVPQSGTVNPAPQVGTSGLSIMAAASDPDAYSLKNTLALDSVSFGPTSESCGGSGKQATNGKLNHVHPRVSENYVVYEEWNAGTALIGMYDIKSGNLGTMYPASQQQTLPDGSGKLIVYEQDGAYANSIKNVYVYDTQSQTSLQLSPSTTNQDQPAISGRYVVWQDWSSGNADIALADLNSGQSKLICKDLGDQKKPAISGNYVVWEDWRNGNADIYMYDIAAGKEYQLTSDKSDQKNPRISGKMVVWEDNRNGGTDIYALNLETLKETSLSGTGKAVNPDVSGALVTWEDSSKGNANIMLLDLITGKIYQLTSDQYDHKNPSIYGGTIAWEDYSTGNPNICIYTLRSSGPVGGKYQFYGSVSSCGNAAPVGSVITAVISGSSSIRGSITLTQAGIYGSQYGPYLEVPVYADDAGKAITFSINDKPASQTVVVGNGGTQPLDLSASCSQQITSYQFSGQAVLDSQNAPVGTVISAMVDGNARSQVTIGSSGQYSGLTVPVYTTDSGKYISFTATYNGAIYSTSQQILMGSTAGSTGSGGVTLMSAESAGTVTAEGIISQRLDLTFTSQSAQKRYLLNGAAMIGTQYAPSGTVITAYIDNQQRSQVTVNPDGQYSGLSIPIYRTDSGKYLTFTAVSAGVTYSCSQQIQVTSESSSSGSDVTLMSADATTATVSAEGTISQRLDLTFSTSVTQTKYRFYGTATVDGMPLQYGRTVYGVIDGQIRGQIALTTAGQYGSSNGPYLEVPIYQSDIGKTIRFQTDSGAEADQTQLVVNGMTLSKSLYFSSKPAQYAEFSATPLQGTAPLSVKFTDKSTGSPKSYYWDFGDGSTSTESNPLHIYQNNGVYSVGLIVNYWNGQSKTVVKQSYVTVGAVSPPNAQIGLNQGWNFISTPKMLADGYNTAKALFGGVDVGGHSIFSYNPRSKTWNTITATTQINPLDAIWIYSTKKSTIPLYFASDALQIPPTKKLVKGWNTFGVTSLNTIPAYNTLLSIKDRWVYVIGYDSATQRFQNTIMNVPDSAQGSLYPGYGYWIYMSDEGELAAVGL